MEASVRTDYSYRKLLNLQYFHMRQKRGLWFFIFLCCGVILWLFISSLTEYGWNPEAYIELAFLAVVIPAVPVVMHFSLRRAVRMSARLGASYNYTFSYDGFSIASLSDHYKENSHVKYKSVYKIYETKDCFYIYITKMQAYILDKNGFTNGSCDDLRAMLRAGVRASALKIYD